MLEGVEHADCSVRELGFKWVVKCSGVVVLSWLLATDSGVVGFADDSVGANCSDSVYSGVSSVSGSRDVVCDDSVEAPEQNRLWVWVMWIVFMGVGGGV